MPTFSNANDNPLFSAGVGFFVTHVLVCFLSEGWPIPNLSLTKLSPTLILVSSLLVFVDTIKELPITFILRPFDFDTLSVRIYQYAGDERIVEAILPAILITILGLIASSTLIPTLEKKN